MGLLKAPTTLHPQSIVPCLLAPEAQLKAGRDNGFVNSAVQEADFVFLPIGFRIAAMLI